MHQAIHDEDDVAIDPHSGKVISLGQRVSGVFLKGERVDASANLCPVSGDPLRGLEALRKVALFGGDCIRELASKPVEYIWQDIAIAGIIVLLAGGPSEGKTTLLFLILVARASQSGMALLGRWLQPAREGRYIVVIEGEHGEASASRKVVRSCEVLNVDLSALDRFIMVARKAVRLGSPEWLDVQRLVAAGLVSDIAVDTVARVAPADADNEREQVAVFDQISQTIEAAPNEDCKPVVWAVGHTRKNTTSGGLADVSGSVQRTGQADTVLIVKGEKVGGRTVSSTVTFEKLREEPDDYPEPVTFSIVANDDGSRRLVCVSQPGEDDRPLESRILERLQLGPRTKNKLSSELGRNKGDIDQAITNLFDARSIETTSVAVRGRTFKAFQVRRGIKHLAPDLTPDLEISQ